MSHLQLASQIPKYKEVSRARQCTDADGDDSSLSHTATCYESNPMKLELDPPEVAGRYSNVLSIRWGRECASFEACFALQEVYLGGLAGSFRVPGGRVSTYKGGSSFDMSKTSSLLLLLRHADPGSLWVETLA